MDCHSKLSFILLLINCTLASDIFSRLNEYELIEAPHFRIPRSTDDQSHRRVRFSSREKSWILVLNEQPALLSPTLSVTIRGANGSHRIFTDFSGIFSYKGFVLDQKDSSVTAIWDEQLHLFSAHIILPNESYFLETLSAYSQYRANNSLLFYRLRDIKPVKFNYPSLNDEILANGYPNISLVQKPNTSIRIKRATRNNKLCSLTFIADYTFFKNVGEQNEHKTTRIIITLFHRLNALYQSAMFLLDETVEESGYGFLLGDIIIHNTWTKKAGHYNAPSDVGGEPWTASALSNAFNRAEFNETCLAHLLTYRPFMGILGRAWTAAPEFGGICSPKVIQDNEEFHANTGWTTYVDHSGRRLLNAMVELITAHELGHNWGAAHDPDTDECSPSASSRGKYLMYAHSVAGFAENNYKFSPCSLRTIGATLAVRAPLCFVSSSEATLGRCGNRRLDPGEECDAGGAISNACCTPDCKLKPGARCSPWNHDCCTSTCDIAPPTAVCAESHSGNPCLGAGRCNGTSPVCPGPTLLSGVPCAEHGQCVQGQCKSHCARHGLKTCICDAVEESCFICCLFPQPDNKNSACRPIQHQLRPDSNLNRDEYTPVDPRDQNAVAAGIHTSFVFAKELRGSGDWASATNRLVYLHLEDHRPCTTGYCVRGKCQTSKANLILRFWGLYDDETADNPLELVVRNNLVLLIISLSLLLWIPGAVGVRKWKQKCKTKAMSKVKIEYQMDDA